MGCCNSTVLPLLCFSCRAVLSSWSASMQRRKLFSRKRRGFWMMTRLPSARDKLQLSSCRPRVSLPTARRTRTARSKSLLWRNSVHVAWKYWVMSLKCIQLKAVKLYMLSTHCHLLVKLTRPQIWWLVSAFSLLIDRRTGFFNVLGYLCLLAYFFFGSFQF